MMCWVCCWHSFYCFFPPLEQVVDDFEAALSLSSRNSQSSQVSPRHYRRYESDDGHMQQTFNSEALQVKIVAFNHVQPFGFFLASLVITLRSKVALISCENL